ncbi:hypothetical protein [Staphylococcus aureus]|uniref:hypothetical protein n=1 Tax=Staphylococcus aureus TaxID=1280 RepID=UPI0034A19B05
MPHDESDDFEKTMFEDDEFENPEDTDNEDAEYDKVFSQQIIPKPKRMMCVTRVMKLTS